VRSPPLNLQSVPSYPATTLAGVLRAVVALFVAMGDTTPIYVGERYLRQEGKPRRIILVPDDGEVSGVLGVGEGAVSSVVQTCTAYLWGAETADDLTRYDDADTLLDRFVNALVRCAVGRLKDAPLQRGKETDILTYGEEYRLRFGYEREIAKDQTVWNTAIPPLVPQYNPPPFDAPPGTPASTIEIDLSTTPKDPTT